ncbi:MAG: serine/threonine protein kinase, partial [Myxococcales bacterium]|nr:serine/threonine protein kinase [Myxococcales bacterium]
LLRRKAQQVEESFVRKGAAVWQGADRYELLRPLGEGGMAEVYLARQKGVEGFEKHVVIKKLRRHYVKNPIVLNLFIQEARLAAHVSHPHVVQIFELGREADDFFIAMELVDGWNLRQIQKRVENGVLPPEYVCKILGDACAGLHAAHIATNTEGKALGIVHRDATPHNIIISKAGVVKITDFGVARATQSLARQNIPLLVGKLRYMAPEQLMGDTNVGPAADIFSLGVSMYECLCGEKPFRGSTDAQIVEQILKGAEGLSFTGAASHLSEGFRTIVMRAMAKDPADRYGTAKEMQLALEQELLRMGFTPSSIPLDIWLREMSAPPSHRPGSDAPQGSATQIASTMGSGSAQGESGIVSTEGAEGEEQTMTGPSVAQGKKDR